MVSADRPPTMQAPIRPVGLLLRAVGLLALASALLVNPWTGALYRPDIVDYRDVMLVYCYWSCGLGLVLFGAGWLFARRGSARGANLALLLLTAALVLLADRALLAYHGLPYWVADPQLHYRHRPNAVRSWGDDPRARGRWLRINEYGHHDDDFPVARPDGELRGVLIGDSITMGQGVSREETFANQLEGMLGRRDRRHRSHQIINAGVEGYSTYQELQILRESLRFDPQFIAVGFCMNDITMPFELDPALGGTGVFGNHTGQVTMVANPLLGYLLNETGFGRLIHALRAERYSWRNQRRTYGDYDIDRLAVAARTDAVFGGLWDKGLEDLTAIYELAKARDIEVVLLVFPHAFQILDPQARMPQKILADHARRHGVGHIDFTGEFERMLWADLRARLAARGEPPPAPEDRPVYMDIYLKKFYVDHVHFTADGHRFVAARLGDYLRSRGIVDWAPPERVVEEERARRLREPAVVHPKVAAQPDLILKTGVAYRALGAVKNAISLYEKTLDGFVRRYRDDPTERTQAQLVALLVDLGAALQAVGKPELARQSFARALQVDPDNAAARAGLGESE